MNEEKIQQIKDSIRQLMQMITARGQPLSEEVKAGLAKVLDHARTRIEQLRQQESEGGQEEPIQGAPIEPPMPIGTELLWHLANGNPEAFVGYLRTVPDSSMNGLLYQPELLKSIVDRLTKQFPKAAPESSQGVEKAPLESSNIYGFNYDQKSGTLRVKFQGDGVYQYQGVPSYIFKIFQSGAVPAKTSGSNEYGKWWEGKAPSLGASFYELIRNGGYPYAKVA